MKYIRNEKHLYCEAIDLNHYVIDGNRYVLNVERGSKDQDDAWVPQLICLYFEE